MGKEVGAKVVDTYRLMGSGDQTLADGYLHDGVHFTAEGNRKLFEGIRSEILLSYPELNPALEGGEASMQCPHFSEIDPINPRESVLQGL